MITSDKSNTNSILHMCFHFLKRNTDGPDPNTPVLPPLTNLRCWSNKDLLIGKCLPGAVVHLHPCHGSSTGNPMPLPPNSESVFSGEHLPEDTTSLLVPLSKDPKIRKKARRFLYKIEGLSNGNTSLPLPTTPRLPSDATILPLLEEEGDDPKKPSKSKAVVSDKTEPPR